MLTKDLSGRLILDRQELSVRTSRSQVGQEDELISRVFLLTSCAVAGMVEAIEHEAQTWSIRGHEGRWVPSVRGLRSSFPFAIRLSTIVRWHGPASVWTASVRTIPRSRAWMSEHNDQLASGLASHDRQ